jgi:intein/homing endonuclease
MTFERLWDEVERDGAELDGEGVLMPQDLEVLTWAHDAEEALFLPVMCLTRRSYSGEMVDVRTKTGRRVTCTADHPWYVTDGGASEHTIKLAAELTQDDWLPVANHRLTDLDNPRLVSLLAAAEHEGLEVPRILVRPREQEVAALVARPIEERREIFGGHRSPAARTGDVKRSGVMRLGEAALGDVSLRGAAISTTKNGAWPSIDIELDEAFWRVAGLYIAEGHMSHDAVTGARRIAWSFHPAREEHLVDQVVAFWLRHGVRARVQTTPTSRSVIVQSRLLGAWWSGVLGMGAGSYEQRLPDSIWRRTAAEKWALLSGLFEGGGSWSLVNGGPSVIIEMGTVSAELADGVLRLLGDLGIVASQRIGRVTKSTRDTHWLRIAGADQVERAIVLVPERDRPGVLASIARQGKRIAPSGHRAWSDGTAWARVTAAERRPVRDELVYSMEVVGTHSFVATGGLVTSNCFPKDVSALKQLAGNSGYHFQLLNAVIEVNELQKRRVIGKLEKHLGTLVGKRIALLGLAFKPNTDDMREASSLVLAARLQAAGAEVSAFDPIAEEEARQLMHGVRFAEGALDAVNGADAVVLVTEWDEFRDLDLRELAGAMSGDVLIDGRNALDPDAARAAGLRYEGIGRSLA